MVSRLVLWLVLLGAFTAALLQQPQAAHATFHCMRVAAVMGGANSISDIQYVELRMNTSFDQRFVGNQQIRFRDAAGNLKATFTFPDILGPDVLNFGLGVSILVATQEFADNATVAPDFIFSAANTTANMMGADVNHPIPVPAGKVAFAEGVVNCLPGGPVIVDSVAYGSTYIGPVDYGSKFPNDLPTTGTQALVVSNLNAEPANNATEYSLQTVPASVPPGANTPRNNAGAPGSITPPDSDGDTVPDPSDNCPAWPNLDQSPPPWPVILDGSDPDCDGWTTTEENFIGTNPNLACSTDNWPPDITGNHQVDISDLALLGPPRFFTGPANANYLPRLDLSADSFIDISDLSRMGPPIFFATCSP